MSQNPCVPDHLPLNKLNWQALMPSIGRANRALARYDGLLQALPNPAVLLSPIIVNEAVLSSKIEGTQATLDEVLENDAGMEGSANKRDDFEEINNYRTAVGLAELSLSERPFRLSLVRELHQRLMQGVRGRDKEPGTFRQDQNWIGKSGDTIEKARFVPPAPVVMNEALQNWQDYIENQQEDPLLKASIIHAQFEIIHPFKDGNGRIGRMLVPLVLFSDGVLHRPMFYLSEYLESHRDEYYDRLLAITEKGDWDSWISFFVNAVTFQADENFLRAQKISSLYKQTLARFSEETHSQYAAAAVEVFFKKPIIKATDFMEEVGFNSRVTANKMLRQLEEAKLIQRIIEGSGRRPAVYAFSQLIRIADGRS